MHKKAIENGCTIINQTVENCRFDGNHFIIETIEKSIYKAQIVLGAYGKRAQLDYSLKRTFIKKKITLVRGEKSLQRSVFR